MESNEELNKYYNAAQRLMDFAKSFDQKVQISPEMCMQANADFSIILNATSGSHKLKILAAHGIPQYFRLCPDLQSEALDRHLDLCEDNLTSIRHAAIGQLHHFVDQQLSDLSEKAVDILLQLLQTNLPEEFSIVMACLAQSLVRNASVTIATTWSHLASDVTSLEFPWVLQFATDTFLRAISRGCDNENLICHLEGINAFFTSASESVVNSSEYYDEWIDEDGLTNLMEPILQLTLDPARTSVREIADYLSRILCSSIESSFSTAIRQLFNLLNATVQLCKQHAIKPISLQNFLLKRVLSKQLLSKFANSEKELSVLKIFAESVTFGGEFSDASWINSLFELAKRHIPTGHDDNLLSTRTYQKLECIFYALYESSPFISPTGDTTAFLKPVYKMVKKLRSSYLGTDAIPASLENIFELIKELLRSPERRTPYARFMNSFTFSWKQSVIQKPSRSSKALTTEQQQQQQQQEQEQKKQSDIKQNTESVAKNEENLTKDFLQLQKSFKSVTNDTLSAQNSVGTKLSALKKIPISERIGRKSFSANAEILQPLPQTESKHPAPLSPISQSNETKSSTLLPLNQTHLELTRLTLTVASLEPTLPQQIHMSRPSQVEAIIVGKRKLADAAWEKAIPIKRVTKRGGIFSELIKGIPSVQISGSAIKKHDKLVSGASTSNPSMSWSSVRKSRAISAHPIQILHSASLDGNKRQKQKVDDVESPALIMQELSSTPGANTATLILKVPLELLGMHSMPFGSSVGNQQGIVEQETERSSRSQSLISKEMGISTISMAGDRKNRTNNIHNESNMELEFAVPAEFPEILKDLNREVLRAQPKDIYQFCATYFHNKLAEQRKELIELAAGIAPDDEVNDLKPNSKTLTDIRERKDSDDDMESDDEESEEEESVPPPVTANYNRGRRISVSAESMAPTLDNDFVAVVIPKTDEQKQRIQISIKNNFLFRSCDEEQYRDVVNAMAEKRVATGEEVIRQGGVGDFFYVVETGALDVFVSKNGSPPVKVFEYTDGGSFGELALMYNAPRAATVVATAESVLWALDRVTFRRILMENTSRKRRMYEGFLEEVKLLSSLEPYERHKIADVLESQVYNDSETVIKQGDVGEQFYIIESGEASVSKVIDGVEHQYPGLKKGDYFGGQSLIAFFYHIHSLCFLPELALLTEQPRQATIRAIGRLKVATMGKKAFVRLLGPVVDIIKRNANDYAKIKSHIPSN
ncbi:hypothetical protein HK100_002055 [Physocladia obscura]|uniref:cAMP-dependent protein kinase regulatory subunit n=1 Tax=Physocladia obscura TaxID=109957 RepID=A0AAD5XAI5_9FUNG|nr:hypothetical protein HK100_002055 [Physocladia obscura]